MNNFNSQFPVTDTLIHLNHAAVGTWPKATRDAISSFATENTLQGSLNYLQWMETEQGLREKLQQLINAPSANDIALVKNTSEGLSFVAAGLDWQAGDNIVGIRQEFPSNRFPWQALAPQQVEFRQLDLDSCDGEPEDALLALCDNNTRLISISAVQYTNGLRMDLAKVGRFCRERGILFCVDAIQQIGAMPFDVQAIQADFAIADGHKWMLSPEGLGLFYVRREVLDKLRLTQFGWRMAEGLTDYTVADYTPYPNAKRFECGSPNMLGIHALNASIGLLLDLGMDTVWQNIHNHVQYLSDGLQQIDGIEILSDLREERASGILTFRSDRVDSEDVFAYLQDNHVMKVFCATRGGGIRLSPHFYTPEWQLDETLGLIEAKLKAAE